MGALQEWFLRTFARDEPASDTLELTEAMRLPVSDPRYAQAQRAYNHRLSHIIRDTYRPPVPANFAMTPERRREVNLRAADTKRRKRETTAKLCEEIANRNGLHSHTALK